MSREGRTPLIYLDAGWLFLLPGLALLSATVLIPAYQDLLDARWSRDRAAVIEQNRLDRLNRYGTYLDALSREDPSVVKSLAASQLNMIPESFEPLAPPKDPSNVPASVFPLLEPDPSVLAAAPPAREKSRLEIWSTSDRTRVWLIAAGGFCVLIGLLPPAVRSARANRVAAAASSASLGSPRRSSPDTRTSKPRANPRQTGLPGPVVSPGALREPSIAPVKAPAREELAPAAAASVPDLPEPEQGDRFTAVASADVPVMPETSTPLPASQIEPKPTRQPTSPEAKADIDG